MDALLPTYEYGISRLSTAMNQGYGIIIFSRSLQGPLLKCRVERILNILETTPDCTALQKILKTWSKTFREYAHIWRGDAVQVKTNRNL